MTFSEGSAEGFPFKVGVKVSRIEVTKSCFVCVRKASARVAHSRPSRNGRETKNCRHFLDVALQKCLLSQGSGASWSRNARLVVACQ